MNKGIAAVEQPELGSLGWRQEAAETGDTQDSDLDVKRTA